MTDKQMYFLYGTCIVALSIIIIKIMEHYDKHKELRIEYKEVESKEGLFKDKTYLIYLAFGLIIFILPSNFMNYESIRNIIKSNFPYIALFSKNSDMQSLLEFYMIYMHIVAIILLPYGLYVLSKLNLELKQYYGIGEFSNIRKFDKKYLPLFSFSQSIVIVCVFIIAITLMHAFIKYALLEAGILDYFPNLPNSRFKLFAFCYIANYGILLLVLEFFYRTIEQKNIYLLKRQIKSELEIN